MQRASNCRRVAANVTPSKDICAQPRHASLRQRGARRNIARASAATAHSYYLLHSRKTNQLRSSSLYDIEVHQDRLLTQSAVEEPVSFLTKLWEVVQALLSSSLAPKGQLMKASAQCLASILRCCSLNLLMHAHTNCHTRASFALSTLECYQPGAAASCVQSQ